MLTLFGRLFETGLAPEAVGLHGTRLIALHAASDLLIAFPCLAIPAALIPLARRRRDLFPPRMLILFACCIVSCGISRALSAFSPVLALATDVLIAKACSGVLCTVCAVCLFRRLPFLLRMPREADLEAEILERHRIEREIREMNRYLELRVVERTNELERTNLRLVESELRLRNILDAASPLVYVKDLKGRYTFINKAFSHTLRRQRNEILGHTDAEIFPDRLARIYWENDRRSLAEGALEFEEPGEVNGAETVYASNKFPLRDFEGRVYAICGMSADVTERRHAEWALRSAHEELRNSEERLRQVMDLVPDMLWSANVDGTNRFVSQRYLDYTGFAAAQFEKEGFLRLFHPDDRQTILTTFQHAIRTGDPAEVECRIRRHDGVYRWFLSRTVPVWNENFQVEYLIGSVTDIHELKRTEQALRRSNEELEQFAYAAAHDLQEPLRNVSTSLGMVQRLSKGRITPDENEWICTTVQNATRMQEMVKDLLQYSRVVSEQDNATPSVSAEEAFQNALTNLNGAASECRPQITASGLPEVRVHPQHLVQIFQNLLGNSLKYRKPDRALEISVQAQPRGAEWEFSVADNGIGFHPAYSDRIFKVFKRLHNRDEYEGNGMGLAICARIVTHYGGRIWAEAQPGNGATFRFTLPNHHE